MVIADVIISNRQKRKLDEMYDELKNDNDSLKRSAIQPASHFFSRPETDLFSNPTGRLDNRDKIRKGKPVSFHKVSS